MGAGSVSKLQYDATMTANSLVDVEKLEYVNTRIFIQFPYDFSEEELVSFAHKKLDKEVDSLPNSELPSDKDTHLRRRLVDEKQVETIGQSQSPSVDHKSVKDPLTWFGVLVPPSLRTAQKNFKEGALKYVQLVDIRIRVKFYFIL